MNMKVIYTGRVWEDGDEPQVEVDEVCSLPQDTLEELLKSILDTFRTRNLENVAIDFIKRQLPLLSPEESSTLKELKVLDPHVYFQDNYHMECLESGKTLPDNLLSKINDNTTFYARVQLPASMQEKVDKYSARKAAELKKREKKRKEREIAKAKMLLQKHGIKEPSI